MVLIICPNCGSSISDKAKACPKCGKSTAPEKVGFLKAYNRFCSNAFSIRPLRDKREFWFGFISSQIINFLLFFLTTRLSAIFISIYLPHVIISTIALSTLSIRRIRGGGKSGFLGIFYLILIYSYLIMLAYSL